jgi:cytochrome P450
MATVMLLFMAVHEASVNVVGNGVLAIMRHREQWQRLINDPGLVALTVEELIRYDSHVPTLELAGQAQQRPEFVIRGLNHLPITAQLR